jgi:hypothetical protein
MTCKDCTSENQRHFSGELTLAFPGIERLKLSTGYKSSFAPSHSFCRCATFWRGTGFVDFFILHYDKGIVGRVFDQLDNYFRNRANKNPGKRL